jgi:hypothetical protein
MYKSNAISGVTLPPIRMSSLTVPATSSFAKGDAVPVGMEVSDVTKNSSNLTCNWANIVHVFRPGKMPIYNETMLG